MESKKNNAGSAAGKINKKEIVSKVEVEQAIKQETEQAQEETSLHDIEGVIYVRTVSANRRFRAGFEFTSTFQAIRLHALSEEELALIQDDAQLMVKK